MKHTPTAPELAIRDLSGLARLAIFHTIHKLREYHPRLSLSSFEGSSASSVEAPYSLTTFCGRTPELLDLLHDVVEELKQIDIYDHDKAERLVGGR